MTERLRRHRRTKIIATLGPASSTPEMLAQLFQAGADVFRLNFSHGSHEEHAARIVMIRALEKKFGRPIGMFQAIKHRCSDMAIQAEAAWCQVAYAALCLSAGLEDATMVGILGILAAVAIPAYQKYQAKAHALRVQQLQQQSQ